MIQLFFELLNLLLELQFGALLFLLLRHDVGIVVGVVGAVVGEVGRGVDAVGHVVRLIADVIAVVVGVVAVEAVAAGHDSWC